MEITADDLAPELGELHKTYAHADPDDAVPLAAGWRAAGYRVSVLTALVEVSGARVEMTVTTVRRRND